MRFRIVAVLFFCCSKITSEVMLKPRYCRTSCGTDHTLCKYRPCLMTTNRCGIDYAMLPLNHQEREEIVDFHNNLRNQVAGGYYDKFNGSLRMNIISYNLELEFMAQCWANLCFQYGVEDPCRKTMLQDVIGQNIYIRHQTNTYEKLLLKDALTKWESTKDKMQVNEIRYLTDVHGRSRDFLQMINQETTIMGCGRSRFYSTKPTITLICNYAVGILKGTPVYIEGRAVCVNESSKYEHLCGQMLNYNKTIFDPPFQLNVEKSRETYVTSNICLVYIFIFVNLVNFYVLRIS